MFIQVVFPKVENVEIPLCYKTLKKAQTFLFTVCTLLLNINHCGFNTEK